MNSNLLHFTQLFFFTRLNGRAGFVSAQLPCIAVSDDRRGSTPIPRILPLMGASEIQLGVILQDTAGSVDPASGSSTSAATTSVAAEARAAIQTPVGRSIQRAASMKQLPGIKDDEEPSFFASGRSPGGGAGTLVLQPSPKLHTLLNVHAGAGDRGSG